MFKQEFQPKVYSQKEISELEKDRVISDSELLKNGARYELNEKINTQELILTDEQIESIRIAVEDLFSRNIFTPQNIKNGAIDITFETGNSFIGYDFEIEQEQRVNVNISDSFNVEEWTNFVEDTYDPSGRCRIRVKNNEPRLSLKIPLFSRDTERTKCCVRLEFKPVSEEQRQDLFNVRDLILKEQGMVSSKKWGTLIGLKNGEKTWVNKDDKGNHWIEIDKNIELENILPEGISYLGHSKSKIKIERQKYSPRVFEDFLKVFSSNVESTSRTSKGVSDTSVSENKNAPLVDGEKLEEIVSKNTEQIALYIWDHKNDAFSSVDDIKKLVINIIQIVNNRLSDDPTKFRSWNVEYGRKVPVSNLSEEMESFYRNLLLKIKEVDRGELKPFALARFIEIEIDGNIHPFADGCGRISKSLASFFLARYNSSLPRYKSRDDYYNAMNQGEDVFIDYYRNSFLNKNNEK